MLRKSLLVWFTSLFVQASAFGEVLYSVTDLGTLGGGTSSGADHAKSLIAASFDEDSDVDADDLAMWQTGFGTALAAKHMQGDANADGVVDGANFLIWQRSLGSGTSPSLVAAPERAGRILGVMSIALALSGRHFLQACGKQSASREVCRGAYFARNGVGDAGRPMVSRRVGPFHPRGWA